MVTHQGNPVSKGAAVGRVYKYVPYQAVVEQTGIRPEQAEEELAAYRAARERAGAELSAMRERLGAGDADKAAILGAHAELLADPAVYKRQADDYGFVHLPLLLAIRCC